MSYKDLLVAVDNSELSEQTFSAALKLAEQYDAHLTALHPISTLTDLPYVGMAEGSDVLMHYLDSMREQSDLCKEKCLKLAKEHSVRVEWQQPEGNSDDLVASAGRLADLIILTQGDQKDSRSSIQNHSDDLLLRLGRPTLIVPYTGIGDTNFKRVLLAWDGSQPATRAVHDSIPVLQQASNIEILNIIESTKHEARVDTETLQAHLLRHGIVTSITNLQRGNINTGATLLNHAADTGADLMVVGAYGHSRLKETIFGGVTNLLLKSMTLPLLMSH